MEHVAEEVGAKDARQSRLAKHRLWLKVTLTTLLILPVLLAIEVSFLNPLFESPDELQHYQFVRYLVDERELPIQQPEEPLSQHHQPPLYYLLGSILTAGIADEGTIPPRNPHWTSYPMEKVHRDNKAQFLSTAEMAFPYNGTALVTHVLRLWSVLLLAGTVVLFWQLGKRLWPDQIQKQLLFLAIAALSPMLIYIGGSVNNDNLVIFLSVLLLLLTVQAMQNGFRWPISLLIGLVWGLALLSKLSAVMLVVPWGVGLLWTSWRNKDWTLLFSRALAISATAIVLSGWWYARNMYLYGEPTGLEQMLDIWGERLPDNFGRSEVTGALVYSWTTFWGRFGYGQVILPPVIYWLYSALALVGMVGLVWKVRNLFRQDRWRAVPGVWLVMVATSLVYFAGLLYYVYRSPTGANGRYIFPAIPAIAALIVAGISAFRPGRTAVIALILLLVAVSLFSVGVFVPWTYAVPPLLTVEEAMDQVDTPQLLTWADSIRLLGTKVEPSLLFDGPEDELTVMACWQAEDQIDQNYTFFVHILDPDLNPLGQRDMHPGLGNFPTSMWQTGNVFCDKYRIPVVENVLRTPTVANVEIGFYDSKPEQRLPAKAGDGQVLDFVVIDRVRISPYQAAEISEPARQIEQGHFVQGVSLSGYAWLPEEVSPGEEATLRLWWAAGGPLDAEYQVFAHLLDSSGTLISQADGPPQGGRLPTNFWEEEIVVDDHTFVIPDEGSPGQTKVQVGLYQLTDGSRLPRVDEEEPANYVEIPGPIILR